MRSVVGCMGYLAVMQRYLCEGLLGLSVVEHLVWRGRGSVPRTWAVLRRHTLNAECWEPRTKRFIVDYSPFSLYFVSDIYSRRLVLSAYFIVSQVSK